MRVVVAAGTAGAELTCTLLPHSDRPELDLSAASAGSPAGACGSPGAGAAPGEDESELGPSQDPRRTGRPGLPGGGQHRVIHPDQGRAGSGTTAVWANLGRAPQ